MCYTMPWDPSFRPAKIHLPVTDGGGLASACALSGRLILRRTAQASTGQWAGAACRGMLIFSGIMGHALHNSTSWG